VFKETSGRNTASGREKEQDMNQISTLEDHAALSLLDNCVYLAMDGSMRSYAKTVEFFSGAGKNPAMEDGRVLALYHVSGPQDVHYPVWEMHPEGDELLILASGSLSVEFRERETKRTAPLPPRAAFIVPAGIWHRIIVDEPSVLLVITPRHNTMHENE
jgi:mannose-6-phosphate isomerase-like protein (cupin superfamily)